MRRCTLPIALLTALALLLSSTATSAEAQGGEGSFRLGGDLSVLTLRHFPNPDLIDPPDPTVIFGVYGTAAGTETGLLFVPQFAYSVTDDILIGAHVGFAVVSVFGSDASFVFHILPFFEYLFGSENIRPYIGAELGPRILSVPGPGSDADMTFLWSAIGGVHIFTGDDFSVSPFARAGVMYSTLIERTGYEIVLGVSFEGWIGGDRSSGGAAEEPPPPANNPPPPAAEPAPSYDDTAAGTDTTGDDGL